jgi:hypothetical protein
MKTTEIIVVVLVMFAVFILCVIYYSMKTEQAECSIHPYTYSVNKLAKDKGFEDLSCFCNHGIVLNTTDALQKQEAITVNP